MSNGIATGWCPSAHHCFDEDYPQFLDCGRPYNEQAGARCRGVGARGQVKFHRYRKIRGACETHGY